MIKYPGRGLDRNRLSDIMYTCIILHNMIIQDIGQAISPIFFRAEQHRDYDPVKMYAELLEITKEIVSKTTHLSLKVDFVEDICHRENQN